MRPQRLVSSLFIGMALVLAVAMGLFIGSPAGAVRAAPRVVFGPPTEGTKVILPDTSIDGASLWTSPTNSIRAVIAWTGTDTQHHLNIMTSADGLHYTNKHILPFTSLWRPAVVFNVSERGEPYGNIIVAWTAPTTPHVLKVTYISMPGFSVARTLTLGEDTSFTAPSITLLNDTVYVAFAGNDANHSLNIRTIDRTGAVGSKVVLRQWGSISRPDVSYDWATDSFLLAWTGSNNRISFAKSYLDVTHFIQPPNSGLVEWSAWAPSMTGLRASNMPLHWLAWTGALSDTQHHVNVQYTEAFPSWVNANSKATLRETAISGPELGYVGVVGQVLVTWTGTDTAHHLNVAVIKVNH